MSSFQLKDWLVEPHLNRITRSGKVTQLEPKTMDVLVLLLSHAGDVVTSQQLLDVVWADRIVEESAVHQRISQIRSALGDDSREPTYIANIPRRGYRIIANVQVLENEPPLPIGNLQVLANLEPPFPAYTGTDPYVFVCYAHGDRESVYPELKRLRDVGIKLWYDEGIRPSSEWSEELARAIDGCSMILYYVSAQSANSRNCRNEISYAVGRDKRLLSVFLEETELPAGLALSIGTSQGILKYALNDSEYWDKIITTVSGVPVSGRPSEADIDSEAELEPGSEPEYESDTETESTLDSEPEHQTLTGSRSHLAALNRFLVIGQGNWIYLVLALYGLTPLLIAWLIGVWPDRVVPSDFGLLGNCTISAAQQQITGYGGRWNWHQYAISLPLSVMIMRYVFRISYGASPQSPLVEEVSYAPLRKKLAGVVDDWRLPAIAFGLAFTLTAIDQYDVVLRLWYAPGVCPVGVMDWGWSGMIFPDVSTAEIVILTLWTTLEQIFLVGIGLLTALHVYRFNSAYMHTIFVRGRGVALKYSYVLNLDDPDRRFGLRKLSRVFDLQLGMCIAGGVILLMTRYMNTSADAVDELVRSIACLFSSQESCAGSTFEWENFGTVFPDIAQMSVVVLWTAFLFMILWIANVKRLPLRYIRETAGRLAYLEQLMPKKTKYDALLRSGLDANVDLVAKRFRQHHFWPIGDQRATDTLTLCLLMAFLMVIPIIPNSMLNLSAVVIAAVLSFILARIYLRIQQHMLLRVDETLVRAGGIG